MEKMAKLHRLPGLESSIAVGGMKLFSTQK
jgi:hypothetical protein